MAGTRGVYWVGGDGNIYTKVAGQNGVANLGSSASLGTKSFDVLNGLAEINDPVAAAAKSAGAVKAPSNPNNTGSSAALPDKSGDIAFQNSGLSSVDTQTGASLSKIDQALGQITGQYDTEAATNTKSYQTSSDQNQNNLQKNKQTALVNAAQGRQGLNGTLASLGALNGSGVVLANRAVQNGANADLSGAADTYGTNQSSLDTALATFKSEDQKRRDEAARAAADAKQGVQNDAAKTKQSYYTSIANDYEAMGDHANASKYQGLASSLFGDIATTNVPTTNLAPQTAAYTAPALASYLSGNSTQVKAIPAANGATQPGLVATTAATKKKQLQGV